MPVVHFTQNLQRHVACPAIRVEATTLAQALAAVFADNPRARGYVLDEHGSLRKHMNAFIDGRQARDRVGLGDPVAPDSEIWIMQALSGG